MVLEIRGCAALGGEMKYTAKDLAAEIGATLEGYGSLELRGVAAPERASSLDLIFVASPKYAVRAEASVAKCVVLPPGIAMSGKTILRAKEAKVAFAKAAALLRETSVIAKGIH